MNNKKYHTKQYKLKQQQAYDRRFGSIMLHQKICENCRLVYFWEGRLNTKAFNETRFCSRACANSIGGKAKVEKYGLKHYSMIAKKNHKEQCVVCGVSDVLDVHHLDENHANNIWQNLMFLCPNDHRRYHLGNTEVTTIVRQYGDVAQL